MFVDRRPDARRNSAGAGGISATCGMLVQPRGKEIEKTQMHAANAQLVGRVVPDEPRVRRLIRRIRLPSDLLRSFSIPRHRRARCRRRNPKRGLAAGTPVPQHADGSDF